MSVDRSYVARNDAERERLQATIARLGEEDFARPIGHGWTVTAALAHLAFWDQRTLSMVEEWEREGAVRIVPTNPDPINDGELPGWLAMPPREAARWAMEAAEAVDRKVETLAPALAEQILAQRPRSIVRGLHRADHLDEIDRALGG